MGFSASRLSFELTGEGVAIDPATGLLSIPADGLDTGITVIVTATDAAGSTVGRYRLTLAASATEAVAPALRTAPALAWSAGPPAGTAVIGAPVTLDPGAWYGTPAPSLAVAWLLDGVVVAGATGLSYVPQPADDGRALSARVTATNAAGSAAAETGTRAIIHAVPTVVSPLADVAADAGAAPVAVEAAAAFAGAALTFAVNGTGATIDSATGVVTIATDQLLDGERITVTATNSGGSAQASFLAAVRATPPACRRPPALAGAPEGKAVIGTPVTLDPGAWEGVPAPELAIAWLLDGSVVAGAAGTSYAPVAADDGKRLSARVTATNAADEASAETAARAIVHAAPTVAAPLADLGLFVGAPAVVEAAAAFAGNALVFAVEGGGATVDAKGRVSVPATAAGSATVTVTATNSGGSARVSFVATVSVRIVLPVLVLAPVLAGSGRIGAPMTVSAGNWSGVPAPSTSVAWLRDGTAIAGAVGTSYTPVAADDGKRLSARVTAANAGGSADVVTAALSITYAPPVAKGGLLEEILDLGSGVETVAAGADFTGENLSFAVTGAGATIDAKTGLVSIPTDKAVQATVTVTATNSGGSATSSFQVTVEAEDIPFALEADDVEIVTSVWRPEAQETWYTPVVRFPGLAGETVDAIEWTTSVKEVVPDNEIEVVTKVGTGYQLYMRSSAKNVPGASPRVDYSVFRDTDAKRREVLRFRWRRTAEGPWSAMSPAFSVPAVPAPAAGWLPMVARTPQEYAAGKIGGSGYQVLRSFATTPANPNLILASMDQNLPWISRDFGERITTPRLTGMYAGRSGVSVWIDPEDANRMLFLQSVGEYYSISAYDSAWSGIYLSTDGGETVTRVQALPLLTSTLNIRKNLHLIAHAPGGTPSTRTIYAMQVSRIGSTPNAGKIQLWRSTNGGVTWAKRGGELPVATFSSDAYGPYGLAVAPNGDLYQYGRRGAWRSTDGGLTWGSRLSTLPDAAVIQMDVAHGGGVVWATVASNGLYKATDGVNFTKNSALGTKNCTSLGISPADRNYMVVQIAGQQAPSYSTNGGTSWAAGVTNKQLGQEQDFEHLMWSPDHYGIVPKIDDREVWFAYREMHLGISRNHGQTWDWTGGGFDGTHTRGMGFHPTNWQVFAQAQQDRGLVFSNTAGDSCLPDLVLKSNSYGKQITDGVGNSEYISGGSVIIHSSGRLVTLQGHVLDGRVPVIMEPSGGNPIGAILVKGEYLSSSLSEPYGNLDPNDGNTGFLGRYRIGSLNAGSMSGVTFTQMAHHFIGVTGFGGSTVIYGADNSGTDRNLYRSSDRGANWTLWRTATNSFRPVDHRPRVCVCPHHVARMYAPSGSGKVVRIQGVSSPTETEIFDIRTYLGNSLPRNAIFSVAVDPFNENLLYVSMSIWGSPNVFRSTDFGATWEDISAGLPQLDGILTIHPLTSDVVFGCSHGSHVLPPPAGHKATYGIANSVYDRVRSFLASH